MTPIHPAIAELHLVIGLAEQRCAATCWRAAPALEDLRTDIAGDLGDALDRIEAGLGTRLMQAMYPAVDFSGAGAQR